MTIVTQQQLIDAATDAQTLSDTINGPVTPGTVTSRLGQTYKTVAKAIADLGNAGSYAPIASPAFTGTPIAPTAAIGNNTTQIATTAFVKANTAPLASPAFTGTPTGTNANFADNSTKLASTNYVLNSGFHYKTGPISSITSSITLDSIQANHWCRFGGNNLTITLPDYIISGFPTGTTFTIMGGSTGGTVIPPTGGVLYNSYVQSITGYLVNPGQTVVIAQNSSSANQYWITQIIQDTSLFGFFAKQTNNQSVSATGITVMTFQSAIFNPLSNFVPSTGIYTVPCTGMYVVGGQYLGGQIAVGTQSLFIGVNGTTTIYYLNVGLAIGNTDFATSNMIQSGSILLYLNKGDTLRMGVSNSKGDMSNASFVTFFAKMI